MRIFPEDERALMLHGITFISMTGLLIAPNYLPAVPLDELWIFEHWPDLYWIGIPIIFLAVNTIFVFIERSWLGFISVLSTVILIFVHKASLSSVMDVLCGK